MNRTMLWVVVIVVILLGAYMLSGSGDSTVTLSDETSSDQQAGLSDVLGGEEVNATSTPGTTTSMNEELKKEDVVVGTGTEAKVGDKVKVNYVGTLTNGTKFDASADHGGPLEFALDPNAVIKGWVEGVAGMKVGGKRKLTIPPSYGYGAQALPGIPANSTLLFEVELLGVSEA